MTKILITGGAGFFGSHLVEHIIKNTDWKIIVLDKLTYASCGLDRLRDIKCFDDKRVSVLVADFGVPLSSGVIQEIGDVDYIVHAGAESHVDRSIKNPEVFVKSNVLGTMYMLEYAKTLKNLKKMLYFSTDEVFGPALHGECFKEWDRYNSTNPYSASKAGGEELCLAYANTYKLPVFITHTMNIYGERQHPEKFVPMTVRKILNGETVTIHSNETRTLSGSRLWLHARNVSSAVLFLLEHGQIRDKYNIEGEREISNLDMAKFIANIIKRELNYQLVDCSLSRPGHDLVYRLDGSKLKNMGFTFPYTLEQSLEKTINWMIRNPVWLKES